MKTNTSTCKNCGYHGDAFYNRVKSLCKQCYSAKVQQRKKASKPAVVPIKNTLHCPICTELQKDGPALHLHLKERHLVEASGKYHGKILGLDVVPCLMCGKIYRRNIYKHLQQEHGLTQQEYLNHHPYARLYPFDLERLLNNEARPHNPNKASKRSVNRPSLKEGWQRCYICMKDCRSLKGHYAKAHPELERVPIFQAFQRGEGPTPTPEEALVAKILQEKTLEETSESRVYFIQAGGPHGPIKIGVSTNLKIRMESLQVGCPAKLHLLATHKGGIGLEKALHTLFHPFAMHGEWFKPDPLLLNYILGGITTDDTLEASGEQSGYDALRSYSEGDLFLKAFEFIEREVALDPAVPGDTLYHRFKDVAGLAYKDPHWFRLWVDRIRNPQGKRKHRTIHPGDRYKNMVVLEFAGTYPKKGSAIPSRHWRIRCVCGNEKIVDTYSLKHRSSCGCMKFGSGPQPRKL